MSGIILFLLSFSLVFTSSYFITTLFRSKKLENSLIYFILVFTGQIICAVELLSLIKQVKPSGILVINLITFVISLILWKYNDKPSMDRDQATIIKNKIVQAFLKDKILLVLLGFFIYSSLISLFFAIFVPSNSWDVMAYHLARIGFWLQNHTLAHFSTSSIRQTAFAVNSEILILWSMVFMKRDYLSIFPQYLAYWGCILIMWSYLSYLKISVRKILWTIFIFASLPAVITESSSCQTDIIVGVFLFASLYLFIYGVKEKDNKAIIFSAIAFALDIGIKYSVLFYIPIFGIIYLLISIRERKKEFYKPLITFIFAGLTSFLLFSSYNYILNFIGFGNVLSSQSNIDRVSLQVGYKSFLANLIRNLLLFVDFTGIKAAQIFTPLYLNIKESLFHLLMLKNTDGLSYLDISEVNTRIHENHSRYGLLGFIVLLPLIIKYSFNKIISSKDQRFYLGITGLVTVGYILTNSEFMGFCYWNNRYTLSAIILSSALFSLCYTKKTTFLKIFIVLIAIFNYFMATTFNSAKPLQQVFGVLKATDFISARKEIRLRDETYFPDKIYYWYLLKYMDKIAPDNSKIGLIFADDEWYYPFFEENSSWKIYPLLYKELIKRQNYNDYDFLIFSEDHQDSYILNKPVYNYVIQNKNVIYNQSKVNDPIILYLDKFKNCVTSNPVTERIMINFTSVPANFKLVKKMQIAERKRLSKEVETNTFYIYRRF